VCTCSSNPYDCLRMCSRLHVCIIVCVYLCVCVSVCVDVQLCTITGVSAFEHVCTYVCERVCSGARHVQTKGLGSDHPESGTSCEQAFRNLCHLGAKPSGKNKRTIGRPKVN